LGTWDSGWGWGWGLGIRDGVGVGVGVGVGGGVGVGVGVRVTNERVLTTTTRELLPPSACVAVTLYR